MEHPAISLIFVNYRSARYLEKALRSLFRAENQGTFEVIIVNNDASESKTLHSFQRAYPIQVLEAGGNKGFGTAANLGAEAARGTVLGFLNPDVEWPGKQLEAIQEVFSSSSEPAVLGISLLDASGKEARFGRGQEVSLLRIIRNHLPLQNTSSREVAWVSGGALFIPRTFFQKIKGFDQEFFLYYEDVDLCKRARQEGAAIRFDPRFTVTHFGGKSQDSRSLQKERYYASQKRYFEKHRILFEQQLLFLFHRFRNFFL